MENKHKYVIYPDKKLIVEQYNGLLTLESYINLKNKIWADNQFVSSYDIIADLRNSEFETEKEVYADIINFSRSKAEKFTRRKSAIIVKNPEQMVDALLYEYESEKKLPTIVKVFSTIEAAIIWCGLPLELKNEILISD